MQFRFAHHAINPPLVFALLALNACGSGGGSATPPLCPTATPIATAELRVSERYFRVDGRSRFLTGRNLTGSEAQVLALMERTAAAGSKLMRVHLTHGRGMGMLPDGSADPIWLASWDRTFDAALKCGLYVIPVFGVWADFNDGNPNFGFANWRNNPLNARGVPGDLYVQGSAVQDAWLAWLGALTRHWQGRPNILAWEVFSELDLISGATETGGVEFVMRAKTALRQADPAQRPVTASLAGSQWFSLPDVIDFVQVHVYGEQLDELVINRVREKLAQGAKGVLLGESGLSALAPDSATPTTAPQAPIATRHASWAALVAGAMNGRALWWEDAYAMFHLPGMGFVENYPDVERGIAKLAASHEVSSYRPLDIVLPSELFGAAIGSESGAVMWVRSARCTSPMWECTSPQTGRRVTVPIPGTHPSWTVRILNTLNAEPVGAGQNVDRIIAGVEISLPDIADDVALIIDPR
jgi:hypothetical protein